MMKDVYIFDLDGTLVDSMPYFSKAILSIPAEEKIDFDPAELIYQAIITQATLQSFSSCSALQSL